MEPEEIVLGKESSVGIIPGWPPTSMCVCVEGGPHAKSVWIIACGDILKMPAEIIHFFEVVFITLWLRRKAHGHSCGLAPPVSCLGGY